MKFRMAEQAPGNGAHFGLVARSVASACLPALLLIWTSGCSTVWNSDSTLRSIRDIKKLRHRLDQRPVSARISGVVTYWDPDWRIAFVQDATGGLRLQTSAFDEDIDWFHERVEIDAGVGVGGDWPALVNPVIRHVGNTPDLNPPLIRLDQMKNGGYECQLVRLEGVIQAAEVTQAGRYRLRVATPEGTVSAQVADVLSRDLHPLIDAEVILTGVISGKPGPAGGPDAFRMWLQTAEDTKLVRPPLEITSLPIRQASIRRDSNGPLPLHRVRLRGRVALDPRRGGVLLKDTSGEIKVIGAGGETSQGDSEENVIGFLEREGGDVVLASAIFRTSEALSARALPREPLRKVRQIHDLTVEEASEARAVHLRGVVTYYDKGNDMMFVQDDTGGIYMPPIQLPDNLVHTGDLVEVDGATGPGEYAPVVSSPRVKVVGRAAMPAPASGPTEQVFTGVQDGNWIQLEGVVASEEWEGDFPRVQVMYGQHMVTVLFPKMKDLPRSLRGATVQFHGVCGTAFNLQRQLTGVNLFVPGVKYIKVVAPPPKQPPVREIAKLLQYSPEPSQSRPRIEGIVTRTRLQGPTYIQDATGSILLEHRHQQVVLQPGDRVQAMGTVVQGPAGPCMREAEIMRLRHEGRLMPTPVAADEIVAGVNNAELIQVEGILTDTMVGIHGITLILQSRGILFTAQMDRATPAEELRVGSVLRLRGICNLANDPMHAGLPDQFEVLLDGPEDIEVIAQGPWWSPRNALLIAGSLALLVLLGALWALLMRRRLAEQTLIIRSKLERERMLESQLAQAQKLESIGRLAGGIAHDFNNLLTVINGYADLLLSGRGRNGDSQIKPIEEIKRAGERAAELTQQLLAFSRKQIIQPRPLDLNELLRGTSEMLSRLVGEDIKVVTRLNPNLRMIMADPGQLHQVLMNLAANARDAMPLGGEFVLETRNVGVTKGQGAAAGVEEGPYVLLSASDTGVGMDEKTRQHIFEPFFTTKASGHGTGLGLATAYGIVRQNHGFIEVESERGRGTTFRLYFPRTTETVTEEQPAGASVEAESGGTVLVVEDVDAVRRLAVEALAASGYDVFEAANGDEALRAVQKRGPGLQLLVTDVVMPGMNGRQLADHLKQGTPEMKVLYVSGHPLEVLGRDGELEAGIDFLAKPFTPQSLVDKVRTLLGPQRR